SAQETRAAGGVVLAFGAMLLATAMFGVSVEGPSRWARVGGVSLQVSLVVLPALLVPFARSSGLPATPGVALPPRAPGLQPAAAGGSCAVTLLRPDSLPAMPYVDQILYTSFAVHPLAGIAVLGGALLLIVPALAGFWMDSTNRAVHAVFGLVWLGLVVAAALG